MLSKLFILLLKPSKSKATKHTSLMARRHFLYIRAFITGGVNFVGLFIWMQIMQNILKDFGAIKNRKMSFFDMTFFDIYLKS